MNAKGFQPTDYVTVNVRHIGSVSIGGLFAKNSTVYEKIDRNRGRGVWGTDEGKTVTVCGSVVPLARR